MEWSDKVKPIHKIEKNKSQLVNNERKAVDSWATDMHLYANKH